MRAAMRVRLRVINPMGIKCVPSSQELGVPFDGWLGVSDFEKCCHKAGRYKVASSRLGAHVAGSVSKPRRLSDSYPTSVWNQG